MTLLEACEPLAAVLSKEFVKAYLAWKKTEYEVFFYVISSWEHKHLLLHV
ncbi:Glutamine synthetase (EC 6.3.1.2) [Mycetohabitans rhizoxinica HKI 454]|uniref:Glutamine synthetase n=1 Tax=Mycetohabitans rhizoxinica (strain DSM 19002 / CIP 109453 / HKI 454) TaxID=882378 RepID=E5APX7_MYCRK|nr:Glutamine synthetase (EC 6.3.1.2) [Mycetohabitans rhizoxinica HKI 454]